jgi:transcription initiation factor TFIIF subunit beta
MCRNRILSHTVRSDRYVKTVDKSELSMVRSSRRQIVGGRGPVGSDTNNTTSSGFGGSVQQFGKRLLDAQNNLDDTFSNSRKRKFEGQPVRSVIFELFEHQPIWSVKELRAESGRLEKEIRQVLGEICEFHRSGEHKGFWELRKEFRKADVNEDTPSSTTAQKPSDAHEKKSSSS